MSEWQPIETAPDDGTNVLLFYDYMDLHEIKLMSYRDNYGYQIAVITEQGDHVCFIEPTHWMPLPAPPSA